MMDALSRYLLIPADYSPFVGRLRWSANGEAIENAAGSRRIAAAEDDVALIDVAGERAFDVVGGMIDVSDFDGGT